MTPLSARSAAVLFVSVLLAGSWACSGDATGPGPGAATPVEVGVVLNSVDRSLTLFSPSDTADRTTIGLGADGSPVGFSSRNGIVAVPLGIVPAVAVVDLRARRRVRTVGLPAGSGATGSAFLDDSTVVVANPGRNSVSRVNVLRGTLGPEVQVGDFPQAVLVSGGLVFVADAELGPDYAPAGPGRLSVLDAGTLEPVGTVQLAGLDPTALSEGPGGRVWVLESGQFGAGNGGVSVVDPSSLEEVAFHPGFGEFPGSLLFGPSGLLHVSALAYGMAVWNPDSGAFLRSPADPVEPAGVPSVAAGAFDRRGRLYTLATLLPGQETACFEPGAAYRLAEDFSVQALIPVGTCPTQLRFVELEP